MKVDPNQIDLRASIPFALMHLGVLAVFFVEFSWIAVGIGLGYYFIRMFGITAGYHRYFSHRTYKVNRVMQFVMALLGVLALQKGPIWWAAHHRIHHRHSDDPKDPHSARHRGFWWSHVGWVISHGSNETHWKEVSDLAKYPEIKWLDRHYVLPGAIVGALMFLLGGASVFVWGFVVSTFFLWHGTFFINSLAHKWGTRRFQTQDDSKNNLLLALITLGEGWHNNHHRFPASTRQGFYWWEIDISYYILKAMARVGLVSSLKEPPLALLLGREMQKGRSSERPSVIEPESAIPQPVRAKRMAV